MSNHNTYEKYVNEILHEAPQGLAKTLKAAQDALAKTGGQEGEDLFKGPGLISNKYGADKKYYPNIRASFMGWRNISLDKASTALIQRLNELKKIDTWNPQWSPQGTELQGMVSTQYSQGFIPAAEQAFQAARDALAGAYQRLQRDAGGVVNNIENDFQSALKALDELIASDTATPQEIRKTQKEVERVRRRVAAMMGEAPQSPGEENREAKYLQNLQRNQPSDTGQGDSGQIQHSNYTSMSMLQKAHVQSFMREFDAAFQKWHAIAHTTASLQGDQGTGQASGSSDQQVDTAEEAIEGTVLRNDGTVYRDQWAKFIDNVQNAVVGASQRGYNSGGDLIAILRGKTTGTYKRRGEAELGKDIQSLDPALLKQVHEKIMVPLFLSKKPTMTYATSDQWESISQGGRLYKGATGLGAQAYSAGSNRPKVSL